MSRSLLRGLALGAAALAVAACKDNTAPLVIPDTQISNDVAASTGDAIAFEVGYLAANEAAASLPSIEPAFDVEGSPQDSEAVSIVRTRTCLDGTGAVVPNCTPLSSVRKIATHFSVTGTRTGLFFQGAVHRVADDTLSRIFNAAGTADSLRVHSGVSAAHDTTSFNDTTVSAIHSEDAVDSINAVTWRLPRTANPYPISGSIVRNTAVHASYTKGGTTVTRDVTKRIEVDFNGTATATLTIDGKTCNLNIGAGAHTVSGCH